MAALTAIEKAALSVERENARLKADVAQAEWATAEQMDRLAHSAEIVAGSALGGLVDGFAEPGEAHMTLPLGPVRLPVTPTLAVVTTTLGFLGVFGEAVSQHVMYSGAGLGAHVVSTTVRRQVEASRR